MGGTVDGSCLCGAVRFNVRGPLHRVTTCHCAMCRRSTTSVGAYTACAPDDIAIQGRKLRWFRSSPIAERGFCARCGSQLFWRRFGGDRISISAGSFDDPSVLEFGDHVFVEGRDGAGRAEAAVQPQAKNVGADAEPQPGARAGP